MMDQEKAQALFDHGAMFLLLDFPTGSQFGVDYNSWNVGPNFRGVKMIPPGIHFISYSAVNSDGQAGPLSGFFYNFHAKEIVVRKWDKYHEDVHHMEITRQELERFHSNKEEMDKFLGPYPYERYKQWVSLTSHITESTVNLLHPDCGSIYSVAQFESEASTTESRKASAERLASDMGASGKEPKTASELLPKMKDVQGTKIKYSNIPKKKYPEGSTPAQITKYSMDSSYVLETIIKERFENDYDKILGEVEFAFVCFLIGQNHDSFEQWKKLVHLMCTCEDAIMKHPNTYLSFISIMHFQIREIPSDFFVDIVTSNNFLTVTLHELFQNLLSDDVNPSLKKRGLSFQKHLTDKFKWDFTSEPDDCEPVVVEDY